VQFREDLGRRIRAARLAQAMTVKAAAAQARISRDTWNKVELGESVQDAKLQAALDAVGLSEVPADQETLTEASLEEVVAALLDRVERLEKGA
jgi:transcriptional regulator with XRE-family HTH domain